MARILGYIAASLDGHIADANERLGWLFRYDDMDLGEHDHRTFLARIRTVVMGRSTFDFLAREDVHWAYGAQRVIVVTSRPIADPKGPLETRNSVDELITEFARLMTAMSGCSAEVGCRFRSWNATRSTRSRSISSRN